jgi:O-antigen ligase
MGAAGPGALFLDCPIVSGAPTTARGPAGKRALLPGVGAFLVYGALAFFSGSQEPAAVAGLAVAVATGVTLLAVFARGLPPISLAGRVALGAMAVLVALIVASSSWTSDDGRVYVEAIRALAYLGALYVLMVGIRAEAIRPILGGVAAAIVAIATLAVASRLLPGQLTGDSTFLREFPAAVRGRLSYPIGYWNGLAAGAAGGVVLLGWLGGQAGDARGRAAAIAGLPLLLLTIYLSGSRGGLLAAVVGVALMLALTPMRIRALAGIAIGAGGGLALAVAASSDQALVEGAPGRSAELAMLALIVVVSFAVLLVRLRADVALKLPKSPRWLRGRWLLAVAVAALVALFVLGDGIERVGDFSSPQVDDYGRGEFSGRFLALGSNGRVQLWESAIDAWKSEPLHGIGAGAFGFWWNQHGTLSEPARDAHSLFLESLAELGPLGLAAVLALIGSGFAAVRRLTFGDIDGTVAALAGLLAAGVMGAAVDWTWEIPAAFGLNLLAIGLLCGPLSVRAAAPTPARSRRPAAILAGRALIAAAGAAALIAAGALLLSERALDQSRDEAAAGDYAAAAASARDAARLQPDSADPWIQLGQVQTLAGDYAGGAESFTEAAQRSPQSPQVALALSVALHSIGDPRADEVEQQAVALLPANR